MKHLSEIYQRTFNSTLLLLILVVSSCQSTQNDQLNNVLENTISKKIQLIDSLKSYSINDQLVKKNVGKGRKIITYIDGTCGSCIYDLIKWDTLMTEKKLKEVDFVYYVRTLNVKQLGAMLKDINFSHPVIIDSDNNFFKQNNLSDNKMLQTFFVDKDNVILAVGNPLYSDKIKSLYLDLIN
jgi:hypothetical protein